MNTSSKPQQSCHFILKRGIPVWADIVKVFCLKEHNLDSGFAGAGGIANWTQDLQIT